jgi:ribosomal subunit interface protein
MNLEIHFREMTSTEALRTHIGDNVEKLKKFVAEGELIKVIVGAEKKTFYCEIFWHDKLQAKDYFAKESGDNLYTQIDNAVDKITHQLQRVHDKNIVKHHKKDPLKRMIATN